MSGGENIFDTTVDATIANMRVSSQQQQQQQQINEIAAKNAKLEQTNEIKTATISSKF